MFLAGPAGVGKTNLVKTIAEVCGIPLHIVTSPQMSTDITGFVDAHGNFVDTEFTRGCRGTERNIILIEEMDRSMPDALIPMNSAIANGLLGSLGAGTIEVNPNVIFMATGNTNGLGQTDEFNTAQQLDGSTLSRFVTVWIDWVHSTAISIADGNAELVEFAEDYRQAHDKAKIHGGGFEYRTLINITRLERSGMFELDRILEIALLKNAVDRTSVGNIIVNMRCRKPNRYFDALNELYKGMTE